MSLNFNNYAQEGNEFLNKLSEKLGHPEDRNTAARVLRAVLHTIRDRITISQAFDVMAQLPMFLKAVFVEQWKYRESPIRLRTIQDFCEAVEREQEHLGERKFNLDMSTEEIIRTVIGCLESYVTEGEINKVMAELPAELRTLFADYAQKD